MTVQRLHKTWNRITGDSGNLHIQWLALDPAGWVLNLSGKPTNHRCIVALDILENLTQGKAGALWRTIGFSACWYRTDSTW